jgi:hypothetical protein
VACRASTACAKTGTEGRNWRGDRFAGPENTKDRFDIYRATLREKTGELLVAVDADAWHERVPNVQATAQAPQPQQGQ